MRTFVFSFVLALIDILADVLFMRIRISRRTGAIVIILRFCTLVLDDCNTCTIILFKIESCRAGARVRSLEILTIVTAGIRRLVLAFVFIFTCVAVLVQKVTRETFASITGTCRDA